MRSQGKSEKLTMRFGKWIDGMHFKCLKLLTQQKVKVPVALVMVVPEDEELGPELNPKSAFLFILVH